MNLLTFMLRSLKAERCDFGGKNRPGAGTLQNKVSTLVLLIETLSSLFADEDENDRKSYFTFSSECACLKFRFRVCGVVEDGKCQCFSLW